MTTEPHIKQGDPNWNEIAGSGVYSTEIQNDGCKEDGVPQSETIAKHQNSWEALLSTLPQEQLTGLSKNQCKKLYKKKHLEETRKEKRQQERERRKAKRQELRDNGMKLPRKMRLRDFKDIKYSNYKIVVDLDFYQYMIENDTRMVVKQVNSCYALNRAAKNPFQFYATSFTGPMKELFVKLQPGSVNWIMNLEEPNYMELFPVEKLVYLTSDSENTLETLEEDKVYVIGGIVDHNQHKGLCHRLAVENGIAHAQLPISKYVNLSTRKVLTINHVFGILSKYLDTTNWQEAFFSVLPKRKGVSAVENSNTTNLLYDKSDVCNETVEVSK